MSTNNICFCGEIKNVFTCYPPLSRPMGKLCTVIMALLQHFLYPYHSSKSPILCRPKVKISPIKAIDKMLFFLRSTTTYIFLEKKENYLSDTQPYLNLYTMFFSWVKTELKCTCSTEEITHFKWLIVPNWSKHSVTFSMNIKLCLRLHIVVISLTLALSYFPVC